jgi:SAM-dependent methyltransferase
MKAYSPKEYWRTVAENFGSADATGLVPVLHPGAPSWFNEQIDQLQFRALKRALRMASLPAHAKILDVGCGTGRWVRRFREQGFRCVGVDATPKMLAIASDHGIRHDMLAGEAFRLPLAPEAFECVTDITVVQHIPTDLQLDALVEMVRVLKRGGSLILMELIRGYDSHVFPRKPMDWVELGAAAGVRSIGWFGQEFLVLDRAFVKFAQAMKPTSSNGIEQFVAVPTSQSQWGLARYAFWKIRRATVPLSAWLDAVVEKVCNPEFATHGVFVFRK